MSVDYRLLARLQESCLRQEADRRFRHVRSSADARSDAELIDELRAAVAARARGQIEQLSGRTAASGLAVDDR